VYIRMVEWTYNYYMSLDTLRDTSSTSLVTAFTYVTFNHGSCQIRDHVIMTIYVIIKQIDSLFGCDLSVKNYIPAI